MRTPLRVVLAATGAAVLLALGAGPSAAGDGIDLSLDGVTWSSVLDGRVFPVPERVVPGDVVHGALWVRNASTVQAHVELGVPAELGSRDGTLAGSLLIEFDGATVARGSRWVGPSLAPGASVRVPLTVTFDALAPASTRLGVADVIASVMLVQDDNATPPGGLAHTGQDLAGALLTSLAAVGFGVLLVALRRRARRSED